jgi:predicted nucleic-acid-binding protein
VDTNVFLRFLVNDDPAKADACEALFQKAIDGQEILFTSDMIIAEIIWVLESYYELKKVDIRESIEKILNTRNLQCRNREIIISALSIYVEKNIDFIDAFNAMMLKRDKRDEIYSYDKHFDRIDWIKRIEPSQ